MRRWVTRLALIAGLLPGLLPGLAAAAERPYSTPVRTVGDQWLTLPGARLPLFANRPLAAPAPDVQRILIVLHGAHRNARATFSAAVEASRLAHADADTLVVAPQFPIGPDIAARSLPADTLRWAVGGWASGDNAQGPTPLSSYAVLDALLTQLADRARYPALREIVLAGHSGGAQMVQRYAITGHLPTAVPLRIVVADPSSYVYFDAQRPGPNGSPNGSTLTADATACPAALRWRYQIDGAPPYVGPPDAARREAAYAARDVVYLLGTADNDPQHWELDRSCAGELEGPDRLARGLGYFRLMQARHPTGLNQALVLLPGVDHNVRRVMTAPCALPVLFAQATGCAGK